MTYTTSSVINSNATTPTSNSNVAKPLIRYSAASQRPIVGRVSDYSAAALRVQIVGQSLPVFIPRVQIGQSDPTLTIYAVWLSWAYNGTNYGGSPGIYWGAAYVIFTPDNSYATVANAPLLAQDLSSEYYYVYSYGSVCQMFNTAWGVAMAQLQAAVAAASIAGYTFPRSPVLERVAGGFRLGIANTSFSVNGTDALANGLWQCGMNDAGFGLFQGFSATAGVGTPGVVILPTAKKPADVYRIFQMRATAIPPTAGPGPDYITTEFDCTDAWCPVVLIQVVSPTLPAIFENVFSPSVISSSAPQGGSYVSAGTANVIVSFGFSLSGGAADLAAKLTYTPSGPWKWVQLVGDAPLTDLTWAIQWIDAINGDAHPMALQPGTTWAEVEVVYQRVAG